MATVELPNVFTLRCSRHEDSLNFGLQNLLLDRDLVDVTLVCDGGEYIRAHKVVLASCSNYFRTMFNEAGGKHPTVVMPDLKMSQLQAILEFIYTGEVNVSEKEILQFFHTSELLKVKGLTLLLQDENLQLDEPLTPETSGVEEVVVAELCESIPYSGNEISECDIKIETICQEEDPLQNEDPLDSSSETIPESLPEHIFRKPEVVDSSVRRSFRKRTRSVRAPSPESILRGSGSGILNPLLFHEENKNVKVERSEMKDITPTIKKRVKVDRSEMKDITPTIKKRVNVERSEMKDITPTIKKRVKDDRSEMKDITPTLKKRGKDDRSEMKDITPTIKKRVKVDRSEMKDITTNIKENVKLNKQNKDESVETVPVWDRLNLSITPDKLESTIQAIVIRQGKIRCRYRCPLCIRSYSYKPHVLRHFKDKHTKQYFKACSSVTGEKPKITKPYRHSCPKCPRTFDRPSFLDKHKRIMHQEVPERKKKGKLTTKEDKSSESKENVKKFQCEHCSRSFEREGHYQKHLDNHTINNTVKSKISIKLNIHKKNVCKKCNKKFHTMKRLTHHINSVHKHEEKVLAKQSTSSTRLYKCTYCNKQYNYQSHVHRHINNIHGKFAQPMKCQVCGKMAQNMNSLKTHMFVSHPGQKININAYL